MLHDVNLSVVTDIKSSLTMVIHRHSDTAQHRLCCVEECCRAVTVARTSASSRIGDAIMTFKQAKQHVSQHGVAFPRAQLFAESTHVRDSSWVTLSGEVL